jgi:hypothetical protein
MAQSIPTTEPTRLRAGDTWQWRREDLSDFPATAWTLTYWFRNSTDHFDVSAAADGTAFAVTVAKANTAAKVAGDYDWVAVVESATERHEIGSGHLTLLPNLATQAAADLRSFARRMLDAIEAALESRASTDQLDLVNATLEARSIQRDRAGLIVLRSQFLAEVRREDTRAKGASPYRMLAVG